ncbi:MAG: ABC transporter permease [Eubacteriales bacterium]|nr:ABC transporter permease [Eubacteriales bacterium]
MVTIIKTEFIKLKRYFIIWIGVALMLLTVLLTLFTTMADDGMVWNYQFLFEQVVKNFTTLIFPMCITLISGYMISREYTDDTLKNIEIVPVSFRKLLAGKLIVSAILSLFLGTVCFAFTVIVNFIKGYEGLSFIPALTGLIQMTLLGFFLYLTMLPIIVLTSRKKEGFLGGVIVAFVYGFIGMFVNETLQSVYPVSAALGMVNYRAGAEGVVWNRGMCLISVLTMCAVGITLMFIKPKPEKKETKKTIRPAYKKGW